MAHGDISHVDIPVSDLQRAQTFYSTLFGWNIADIPGFEGYPMWQAPNKVSGGGLTSRDDSSTQPLSYVEVDSIADVLALVEQQGGRVLRQRSPISETSWWATFEDPDGNVLGLYEGVTDVGS